MHDQPTVTPPRRVIADEVFERVARAIVTGDLPAGARLRDVELEVQFDVSRTPVREALLRLERVGMVEVLASRYTRVTEVTPNVIQASRQYAGYQAGIAARMSVPRLTIDERLEVVHLIDQMAAALHDSLETSSARRRLYSYLSERCGNPLHHALMKEAELALERNLSRESMPDDTLDAIRENYSQLKYAIIHGDAIRAEALVRAQHGLDE